MEDDTTVYSSNDDANQNETDTQVTYLQNVEQIKTVDGENWNFVRVSRNVPWLYLHDALLKTPTSSIVLCVYCLSWSILLQVQAGGVAVYRKGSFDEAQLRTFCIQNAIQCLGGTNTW